LSEAPAQDMERNYHVTITRCNIEA